MFVRLKDLNGSNVTVVAHKIAAFYEGSKFDKTTGTGAEATTETTDGTVVLLDNGDTLIVKESERVIRGLMTKALSPSQDDEAKA